jgi:ubiquinone/menaquinone biosynthesis C-methylase UbiE
MLEHKDRADYWGRFSNTYDDALESMIGKEVRMNLAEIFGHEHDLGDVIEFGCGTGYFTRVIARNARHVTATDLSPRMVAAARSRLRGMDNITFQVQDSESTSLPSDAFDTAFMANMLHTLDDPVKALKECGRVLKPAGTLFIINYTDEGMGRVERAFLFFRFALKFGFPPRKSWPLTTEKLRSLLALAGFRIERMDLIKGRLNAFYIVSRKK